MSNSSVIGLAMAAIFLFGCLCGGVAWEICRGERDLYWAMLFGSALVLIAGAL